MKLSQIAHWATIYPAAVAVWSAAVLFAMHWNDWERVREVVTERNIFEYEQMRVKVDHLWHEHYPELP